MERTEMDHSVSHFIPSTRHPTSVQKPFVYLIFEVRLINQFVPVYDMYNRYLICQKGPIVGCTTPPTHPLPPGEKQRSFLLPSYANEPYQGVSVSLCCGIGIIKLRCSSLNDIPRYMHVLYTPKPRIFHSLYQFPSAQ